MVPFANPNLWVKVLRPSRRYNVIQYAWTGDEPLPDDVTIRIVRGENAQQQDTVVISGISPSQARIVDDDLPPQNRLWQRLYYRVGVFRGNTLLAQVVSPTGDVTSPYALHLADVVRTHLRKTHGRTWHFFRRKTHGIRCPDCYDKDMRRRTKSNCATCYNTTYVDGYDPPIPVCIGALPSAEAVEKGIFAEVEHSSTTLWITNDPDVHRGDLFIEPGNRRWRVARMQPREYKRTRYRQDILADEIKKDDILFTLSVL